MYKRYAVGSFVLVGLLAATFIIRYILLGGVTNVVGLEQAPSLTGIVAQSLYTGRGSAVLPAPEKDFILDDIRYFDNKKWVVAAVLPTRNQFDQSTVLLEKFGGSYEVVLGPGSAFDSSVLLSLPADLGNYLKNQGILYEPVE